MDTCHFRMAPIPVIHLHPPYRSVAVMACCHCRMAPTFPRTGNHLNQGRRKAVAERQNRRKILVTRSPHPCNRQSAAHVHLLKRNLVRNVMSIGRGISNTWWRPLDALQRQSASHALASGFGCRRVESRAARAAKVGRASKTLPRRDEPKSSHKNSVRASSERPESENPPSERSRSSRPSSRRSSVAPQPEHMHQLAMLPPSGISTPRSKATPSS